MMTEPQPQSQGDETRQLIQKLRGYITERAKGRMLIVREVDGIGIMNYRIEVKVTGGNLSLDLEARGLSLHEAAEQMEILVEAVL